MISTKQQAAVTALLTASTLAGAAKVAGVSESTLRRWRHTPTFRQAVEEARGQLFAGVTNRLAKYSVSMVDLLGEIALDEKTPKALKIRAAGILLRCTLETRVGELADRAEELEDAIGQTRRRGVFAE